MRLRPAPMTHRLRNGLAWFFLFLAALFIVVNMVVLGLMIAWAVYVFAGIAVFNLLAAAWIMLATPIISDEEFEKLYYEGRNRKE